MYSLAFTLTGQELSKIRQSEIEGNASCFASHRWRFTKAKHQTHTLCGTMRCSTSTLKAGALKSERYIIVSSNPRETCWSWRGDAHQGKVSWYILSSAHSYIHRNYFFVRKPWRNLGLGSNHLLMAFPSFHTLILPSSSTCSILQQSFLDLDTNL